MSEEQTNVIADLRYPVESMNPDDKDKWSQWISLPMIEMSARNTYHFVKAIIPKGRQRILEIGSGDGYLALELARDGHEVTGLDKSQAIIEVAERTRAAHPETPGFGKLTYCCEDITSWDAAESSFDIVIITRTLHHLHQLHLLSRK